MDNKHHGTKEYFLIYAELITAARYRGTVTYQELADLIGLPLQGNYMGTELGHYLGAISQEEVELYSRPMLGAIVITAGGQPGAGFFTLAQQLGKLHSLEDSEQHKFWEAERQKVYETWRRSYTTMTRAQ